MEPKLPASSRGPEYGPSVAPQNIERQVPTFNPERAFERQHEQYEREVGGTEVQPAAQPTLPPPVALPQAPGPVDDSASQGAVADAPLVANDDDLIEKEWVDKAKKIVSETKDDPYRREAEVGKLQVEYLRKRYGKELGASE